MRRRDALRTLLAAAAPWSAAGCADRARDESGEGMRVVLKHQPLGGDAGAFRQLLAQFERRHPGVTVAAEPLPSSSDLVHQYFLTALEGGARELDVLVVDVVWVAEFARAGWIADLSSWFPPATIRRDFLRGAAEAVLIEDRTHAVPWYVDVGVLFRRSDLTDRAPATYDELIADALRARRERPGVDGYVWQARQYEGLVCNVYEAIWGHGGATLEGERVLLDTPEARAALEHLRGLITRGVSPRSVTSMAEEESRRHFQGGGAAFMRNWPYAFSEAQREGSPVRGQVGFSALPGLGGQAGPGVLGGYQLAVGAQVPPAKRELAARLVAHLTSYQANLTMALAHGRNPARRAVYEDPRLAADAPVIGMLLPMVEKARPRPVTPYYPMMSDALQGELSAAVAGIKSPADALRRAQKLVDHLTGVR